MRPLLVDVPVLQAIFRRRINARPDFRHALDHFHAQAGDGDLLAVVHVVQHQHHAAGREPAEIGIALDQSDRTAFTPRGDGGRESGRTAADHDDVGLGDDGN